MYASGSMEIVAGGELLALLREQDSLYARLEAFAARQRMLVTGSDVGPLLGLLEDRRLMSTALTEIASRLRPFRRKWAEFCGTLPLPEREEAERLLGVADQRLRRVIESDELDARILATRKQGVAATLRAADATGAAMCAYRAAVDRSTRIDLVREGT